MNIRELKSIIKTISGDTEIKVSIPDRNGCLELKDIKINSDSDNLIIESI